MKINLLRIVSISITALVTSSTAFGAMDLETRLTHLENQMQQVRTQTAMGTYGPKTASARPEVNGYGWMFAFDVLYWQARVTGTEFAYTRQSVSPPIQGELKDIDFNWNWGGQVKAGYNQLKDGWNIELCYGWYDTKGNGCTRDGADSCVVPLRASPQMAATDKTFTNCKLAKSEFALHNKDARIELGRAYFLSKYLSLKPHWGIQAAWMNQSQTIRYSGGDEAKGGLGNNTVHVKDVSELRAIGPRVGLDSKWYLGCSGVSIVCNVNGSLPYGSFSVNHDEQFSGDATKSIHLNSHHRSFCPTTGMKLGLCYASYIQNCTQHIEAGLGFEIMQYGKSNKTFKVDASSQPRFEMVPENINTYGLIFDIRWSF